MPSRERPKYHHPTPSNVELSNARKTYHLRSNRKKQEAAIKLWIADMKKNEKDL